MKKRIILFIVFSFLFFIPFKAESAQPGLEVVTEQKGPLNPGDTYVLQIHAFENDGKPCEDCTVTAAFKESQPLDTIDPLPIKTSNEGVAYLNATSFVPINRILNLKLTRSNNDTVEKTINLEYNNNQLLSVIRSIMKGLSFGMPFPPMENVYGKIVKQTYAGGDTRTLYLEYNFPFGTKQFDIYYFLPDRQEHFIKSTTKTKTAIEVSAFEDVSINIEACTAKRPSCVNSNALLAPKITDPVAAAKEKSIPVENEGIYGNTPEEIDNFKAKQEKETKNNPFSNLLKAVYK